MHCRTVSTSGSSPQTSGCPCYPPGCPQIPPLLPLTTDHRPLLELESPDGEQRCLQALLHWAAASATGPATCPACDVNVGRHLASYTMVMTEAVRHGWQPRNPELALVLLAYASGENLQADTDPPRTLLERQLEALRQLREQGSARSVRRQLAEVAAAAAAGPHPPAVALPSLEQLEFVCHRTFVRTAHQVLRPASVASLPVPTIRGTYWQMAVSSEAVLTLQPDNPTSWLYAGVALTRVGNGQVRTFERSIVLSVERVLHGAELARRQGADVAFAMCACNAGLMAPTSPFGREIRYALPARLSARLLATAGEAEAAAKRASRRLPARWVQPLQPLLQAVQHALSAASGRQTPPGAPEPDLSLEQVARQSMQANQCAGCERRAAGLRRCSRCKAVSYCRWVLGEWVLGK